MLQWPQKVFGHICHTENVLKLGLGLHLKTKYQTKSHVKTNDASVFSFSQK